MANNDLQAQISKVKEIVKGYEIQQIQKNIETQKSERLEERKKRKGEKTQMIREYTKGHRPGNWLESFKSLQHALSKYQNENVSIGKTTSLENIKFYHVIAKTALGYSKMAAKNGDVHTAKNLIGIAENCEHQIIYSHEKRVNDIGRTKSVIKEVRKVGTSFGDVHDNLKRKEAYSAINALLVRADDLMKNKSLEYKSAFNLLREAFVDYQKMPEKNERMYHAIENRAFRYSEKLANLDPTTAQDFLNFLNDVRKSRYELAKK